MRYRNSDAIILLGLNPTAADEAQALRRFGNEVTLVANGTRSNWVTVDGQRFDLADAGQVAAFLQHLRVPEPRREIAARAFRSVDPDMGDELGLRRLLELTRVRSLKLTHPRGTRLRRHEMCS